jgi:putative transposase
MQRFRADSRARPCVERVPAYRRGVVRPLRIQVAGLYHIFDRGTGPSMIFPTESDPSSFVTFLERVLREYRWSCEALCLMGTHSHLLVKTTEENLAAGMQLLKGLFAQAFNQRHARIGALFQGRYGSVRIETDRQLLAVVRYIALNPSAAGLCRAPDEWRWSTYTAIVRDEATFPFPIGEYVLKVLADDRAEAVRRLQAFVAEPLAVMHAAANETSVTGSDPVIGP